MDIVMTWSSRVRHKENVAIIGTRTTKRNRQEGISMKKLTIKCEKEWDLTTSDDIKAVGQ
jgi:hypothetical protein